MQAMVDYQQTMAREGLVGLHHFLDVTERFHAGGARLLQTDQQNISYVHSTAEGMNMIASGYPFAEGDEIISYVHEYPSNHYPWRLQERRGALLRLLPDNPVDGAGKNQGQTNGWSMRDLELMVNERTRVVAISHVQFSNGFAADLKKLGAFCREREIDLIVDCAQSLGCLPIYPEKFHISALVASGWKWLMGPRGSAFLYTSPELRRKLDVTMAGIGLMEQGADYLNHSWNPHRDGRFFEYSTLPWDHISGMAVLFEQVFTKVAMEEVQQEVFRLQDLLIEYLDPALIQPIRFPDAHRSGILPALPQCSCKDLCRNLIEQKVVLTVATDYLRLAPHFYMEDEQLIQAAEVMNQVCHDLHSGK
jgi:selenocysteine lyase/cysteine desulfurase